MRGNDYPFLLLRLPLLLLLLLLIILLLVLLLFLLLYKNAECEMAKMSIREFGGCKSMRSAAH
jgi:hypothetical protein